MRELLEVALNVERAGDGPPLLLLHGFTESAAGWGPQVAAWGPFFTTLAVDLPGHGRSVSPDGVAAYTMDATLADLVAVLDRQGVGRAHLLGYSMGGRVALALAVAQPERVGALVLESASPGLADAGERAARVAADAALAERIEHEGVPAFVDYWEALPLWASQARLSPEARAALRAGRLQNTPVGLANSLRGLGTGSQPPLWDQLGDLACPTLLVAGCEDAKFSDLARQMAAQIPDNELLLVHNAGHAVHLEQPAVFARLVRDFLLQHNDLVDLEEGV
jgi:2-succinyl-6-hydroxy-2,4-cyclohexadiene-1-carboxylate synthase